MVKQPSRGWNRDKIETKEVCLFYMQGQAIVCFWTEELTKLSTGHSSENSPKVSATLFGNWVGNGWFSNPYIMGNGVLKLITWTYKTQNAFQGVQSGFGNKPSVFILIMYFGLGLKDFATYLQILILLLTYAKFAK